MISNYVIMVISAFDDFIFFSEIFLLFFLLVDMSMFDLFQGISKQFPLFVDVSLLAFTSWDIERKFMYFWSKMNPELTLTIHKGELLHVYIHLNLQVRSETGKTGTLSPRVSAMMP